MKMPSFFRICLSGCALSLALMPYGARAQNTALNSAEALAADAKIYADAYGVSLDEAIRRLSIMLDDKSDGQDAEAAEGDNFAGRYFDNDAAGFAIIVRTKGPDRVERNIVRKGKTDLNRDPAARAQRRADRKALRQKFKLSDTEVEQAEDIIARDETVRVKFRGGVSHAMKQLQQAVVDNGAKFASIKGIQTVFVDNRTGEIVVMVDAKSPEAARAEVAAFLQFPFRIDLVPGGFKETSVRGGQFTTTPAGRYCMTAFAATRTSDTKVGLVTAGHCATPAVISIKDSDGVSKPLTQGTKLNSVTAGDLLFLSGVPVPLAEFYFDGTGAARSVTGLRARTATSVSNGTVYTAGTTQGSFVCHLGQQVLNSPNVVQSCGEVISINGQNSPTSYTPTGGTFVIVRNTLSGAGTVRPAGSPGTLKCYHGDSGGPWFAGTIAFGIQSGCAWEGADDGITLYVQYTSIDAFSYLGATLLVK
jgi:hypothetical protein